MEKKMKNSLEFQRSLLGDPRPYGILPNCWGYSACFDTMVQVDSWPNRWQMHACEVCGRVQYMDVVPYTVKFKPITLSVDYKPGMVLTYSGKSDKPIGRISTEPMKIKLPEYEDWV